MAIRKTDCIGCGAEIIELWPEGDAPVKCYSCKEKEKEIAFSGRGRVGSTPLGVL